MKKQQNTENKRAGVTVFFKRWSSLFLPALTLVILLLLWEVGVRISQIEQWILPSPSAVMQALWDARELIWMHAGQTIYETVIGFSVAVIVSVMIATVIDLNDWLRKSVYPLLIISQTVPIIAVAPLFMMWFGYGLLPKVIVVALVCFFPITVNLADGYRLVDRDMIRLMESMGAKKRQIFRMVKLPGALPFFFSGLRIAGTYSVMGAVIGEWLGASKGLGILMTRSTQSFLTAQVFATIFVVIILSLLLYFLIEVIARLLISWHYQQES
ncbi:ABC transporter permease [Bacillus sp. Hm123]|uniref:ABC transporter permease n=1 Tax=Bacillus sp. Hm123 TaxID=3450745 RepID=UPI003F427B3B